jgi:plasmid stabilization system protein ParE
MKVTISERAEKNLEQIFLFIEENFSTSACNKFKRKLIKVVNIISSNPLVFPASGIKPEVRKCVVTKQTILYYKITHEEIQIITFQDTRQDPKKLKI